MALVRNGHGPMSSINVTPLTDVLLVLLITFLLTATSFQGGDEQPPLPRVTEIQEISERATVVSLDLTGQPRWPDATSTARVSQLQEGFTRLKASSGSGLLALAVHRELTYERLYPVLVAAEQAGWGQIVLLTESAE